MAEYWQQCVSATLSVDDIRIVIEDDTAKGDLTAIGLSVQLSKYTFVALLHLTADILSTVDHLSRIIQFSDQGSSMGKYFNANVESSIIFNFSIMLSFLCFVFTVYVYSIHWVQRFLAGFYV